MDYALRVSGLTLPAEVQPDPTPRGITSHVEHADLPVRSPGAGLHPLLRRPPVAGGCGAGDSG